MVSEVAEYFFESFFFLTHTVALFCVGLYQTRIETYLIKAVFLGLELSKVNLCSRTEEQRWQTLCDKGDDNFVWNKFASNFNVL